MRHTPKSSQFHERLGRATAFGEVLLISILIQAALNLAFKSADMQLRIGFYEVALVWMFCK
jgi:hypothetical protein